MSLAVALFIASLAVVFDLRWGIVPNWLMLVGLLAVLVSIAITGEPTWFKALLAAGIMVVVWLPVWAGGAIGGGDHKLLIVVGAAIGMSNIILFLLAMAIAGGIQAIAWGMARKNWNLKQQRIPYTVAILVGVVVVFLLSSQASQATVATARHFGGENDRVFISYVTNLDDYTDAEINFYQSEIGKLNLVVDDLRVHQNIQSKPFVFHITQSVLGPQASQQTVRLSDVCFQASDETINEPQKFSEVGCYFVEMTDELVNHENLVAIVLAAQEISDKTDVYNFGDLTTTKSRYQEQVQSYLIEDIKLSITDFFSIYNTKDFDRLNGVVLNDLAQYFTSNATNQSVAIDERKKLFSDKDNVSFAPILGQMEMERDGENTLAKVGVNIGWRSYPDSSDYQRILTQDYSSVYTFTFNAYGKIIRVDEFVIRPKLKVIKSQDAYEFDASDPAGRGRNPVKIPEGASIEDDFVTLREGSANGFIEFLYRKAIYDGKPVWAVDAISSAGIELYLQSMGNPGAAKLYGRYFPVRYYLQDYDSWEFGPSAQKIMRWDPQTFRAEALSDFFSIKALSIKEVIDDRLVALMENVGPIVPEGPGYFDIGGRRYFEPLNYQAGGVFILPALKDFTGDGQDDIAADMNVSENRIFYQVYEYKPDRQRYEKIGLTLSVPYRGHDDQLQLAGFEVRKCQEACVGSDTYLWNGEQFEMIEKSAQTQIVPPTPQMTQDVAQVQRPPVSEITGKTVVPQTAPANWIWITLVCIVFGVSFIVWWFRSE